MGNNKKNKNRGGNGGKGRNVGKSTTPETLSIKFAPRAPGAPKYAPYSTVLEHVCGRIQKDWGDWGSDIAESLENGAMITIADPVRKQSTDADADKRKFEQETFDANYKIEKAAHVSRTESLAKNIKRAYTLIFHEYCTQGMRLRLEDQSDFKTAIKNKPLELLERIKTLTHDPMRAQYPVKSMVNGLARLLQCKQGSDEHLNDYAKRLKHECETLRGHLGTTFLDQFTEGRAEYKALTEDDPDPTANAAAIRAAQNKMKKSSI